MALFTCADCGNRVSDQAVACPKCGRPAEKMGAVVQAVQPTTPAVRGVIQAAAWITAGVLLLLFAATVAIERSASKSPARTAAAPAPPATAPAARVPVIEPQPKPRAPSLGEIALSWKSLDEAITNAKPLMEDTEDDPSAGAMMLAVWSIDRLRMSDLKTRPTTSRGKAMKDSNSTHGMLLCVSGLIIEIAASPTSFGTTYDGGIMRDYDVYRFMAVGDTGNIVANSRARFCGVFTGNISYSNSGGGTTHAPMLVGLFDLPANR